MAKPVWCVVAHTCTIHTQPMYVHEYRSDFGFRQYVWTDDIELATRYSFQDRFYGAFGDYDLIPWKWAKREGKCLKRIPVVTTTVDPEATQER